jgi:NAD(P)-dependent dehydrogenase (short-subunit alcohol dehydrogenase family)
MKKVALITGASGNLGKVTVEKFISEGYQVVATVSPGKTLGYETSSEVLTVEADLTNEKMVEELVKNVIDKYGAIDAALLLVGAFCTGGIMETDGSILKKMYTLNFETAYFTARPVFLQMKKQSSGGRIVLIGARPCLVAEEGKQVLAYALSKSLIFKLAGYLNSEGASDQIITTVIVPGVMDTPLNRKANPTANFSKWVQPEEIAEAMAFVTSNKSEKFRDTVIKIYENA